MKNKLMRLVLSVLTVVMISLIFLQSTVSVNAAIVKDSYCYEGRKHYPYNGLYGTSTASRFKYYGGKIYIQVELGTWRFNGWDHVWLKNSEGNIIRNWDVKRSPSDDGVNIDNKIVYRKELDWIDIGGIKPNRPEGEVIKSGDSYEYDFSGTPNKTATFTYDYYWSNSTSSEYDPSPGISASVTDYLTSFYYIIDNNPETEVTEQNSEKTETGKLDITKYINSSENYYIHIKSKSYTGQFSDQLDHAIEKYHVQYNSNTCFKEFFMQHCISNQDYLVQDNTFNGLYGYSYRGWNTKPDGTGEWYRPNQCFNNITNVNNTFNLYAIWGRPDISVYPSTNNLSFKCNDKVFYKEPVEIEAVGHDDLYNIDRVWLKTIDKESFLGSNINPMFNKYDKSFCDDDDKITVYSGCMAQKGISLEKSIDVYLDYTAPDIEYTVTDKKIKISVTDNQSGVDTVELDYFDNGWKKYKDVKTTESEYINFKNEIDVTKKDYKYKYRIKAKDHLGNTSLSDEFYIIPMTLKSSLKKINGNIAYNGDTLIYLDGGDMTADLNVEITGYPDYVKYEYASELGQEDEYKKVMVDEDGNFIEEKHLILPSGLEHDKLFSVKVIAYRNNKPISNNMYVKFSKLDFSKFRSNIIYQSGQHN